MHPLRPYLRGWVLVAALLLGACGNEPDPSPDSPAEPAATPAEPAATPAPAPSPSATPEEAVSPQVEQVEVERGQEHTTAAGIVLGFERTGYKRTRRGHLEKHRLTLRRGDERVTHDLLGRVPCAEGRAFGGVYSALGLAGPPPRLRVELHPAGADEALSEFEALELALAAAAAQGYPDTGSRAMRNEAGVLRVTIRDESQGKPRPVCTVLVGLHTRRVLRVQAGG